MPIVSFFRPAATALRCVSVVFLTAIAAYAQSPSAADGYDPNVDGNVYALAAQADGKIILGGQFATLHPGAGIAVGRNNIARVNSDGSADLTFDLNANGPVRTLVYQPDGKLLVGGDFTTIAGLPRTHLARFNADGSLDTTFSTNIGSSPSATVYAIVVQPSDGKIVIGGSFTTVGGVTRNRIARLSTSGVVDLTFDPEADNVVFALALTYDNKIIVGGGFTTLTPNVNGKSAGATVRNRMARLNPDGTPDSEFDPNVNGVVNAIAIQRDGHILLGGNFTTLQPTPTPIPQSRTNLARLQWDGQFDASFSAGVSGPVSAIAIGSDGSIVVGGLFTSAWSASDAPSTRGSVAKFSADGALNPTYGPSANQAVSALAFFPDGRLAIGGYFSRIVTRGAPTGVLRNRLARINLDGSVDASFDPDSAGAPKFSVVQKDGKVLIAGTFTEVGGISRYYLARLGADGSLDQTFYPILNGQVGAMVVQSDGKIIIGGAFTTVNGTTRNYIARLNSDGTLDTAYDPNCSSAIQALTLQPTDGKLIVGGAFVSFTPNATSTSTAVTRSRIARLNTDGTVDTPFDPEANGNVVAIAVQGDGKILIGGGFTTLQPNGSTIVASLNHLARLNSDGSADLTYNPAPDGSVGTIAIQSDGKAIVGGTFNSFPTPVPNPPPITLPDPIIRHRLARINTNGTVDSTFDPNANGIVETVVLQGDSAGSILVGGNFTTLQPNGAANWTQRKYAARLKTDGTLDATFDLGLNEQTGNEVTSFTVQSDGKILMCGGFSTLQPLGSTAAIPRARFVRLTATGTVDTTFTPSAGGAAANTIINAVATQTDGRIIVAGNFNDLGGAGTVNIARFTPEGGRDSTFSGSKQTDGNINAVALRPDTTGLAPQLPGLAWLNGTGGLLSTFSPTVQVPVLDANGKPVTIPNPDYPDDDTKRITVTHAVPVEFTGQINTAVIDPYGRIILGGNFTNTGGQTPTNLARFLPDGTLDQTFQVSTDGPVNIIVVIPNSNGDLYIAGGFGNVTAATDASAHVVIATPRNQIAHVYSDATLDTTFDPDPNGKINALIIQPDNKILICGLFTTLLPDATQTGITTAITRNYIARIGPDGLLDTNFNPNPGAAVSSMVLQSDGKIVFGGQFTSIEPNTTTTVVTRNYLARVNSDGTLDTSYDPNPNATVYSLALQPDGKVLIGGAFTALGTTTRYNIARINTDGGVDADFDPNANSLVSNVALQPDGKILISGAFTTVAPTVKGTSSGAVNRNGFARLNSDGSADSFFDPNPNGLVSNFLGLPDGSVIVEGSFTQLQPGGVMYVGGTFLNLGGVPAAYLVALNDDGSANSLFAPNPNGAVNALLVQPDSRLVVGGAFTNIARTTRNHLARFGTDGVLDATFAPTINGTVNALALQSDGKLLVGGSFTAVGALSRTNLARLNPDGSADATFNAAAAGTAVRGLQLQPDGRILVLADGSGVKSVLLRVKADGSADSSFSAASAGASQITGFALQNDGLVVISGNFTSWAGNNKFPYLARLNSDGSLDANFAPAPDGTVTGLALQSDGRVIFGGAFQNVGGLARGGIARVAALSSAAQSMVFASGGAGAQRDIVWMRKGSGPEFSSVSFDRSSDGLTWTTLQAAGTRVTVAGTSSWETGTKTVPTDAPFYVRGRGLIATATGTAGVVELIQQFNLSDSAHYAGPSIAASSVTGGAATSSSSVMDPTTGQLLYVQTSSAGVGDYIAASALSAGNGGNSSGGGITAAHLSNLSVRASVNPANPIVTGFAVSGTTARTVLLRGVGPTLTSFGVTNVLAAPRLRLLNSGGKVLADNSGWSVSAANVIAVTNTSAATGAFPLANGLGLDAAVVVTLAPGTYSMIVQDSTGQGGVALAEIYDADSTTTSQLINLSTRGAVGVGDGAFLGGFVVAGNGSQRLLVRGVGPGLAQFGVTGTVADPSINLFDSAGRVLATNDNWSAAPGSATGNLTAMTAAFNQVGAFALTPGSNDAALTTAVAPGAYTVQVSGAGGATGAAMIEIYVLP